MLLAKMLLYCATMFPVTSEIPKHVEPKIDVYCLNYDLGHGMKYQREEVARRFNDAVVVICHGEDYDGQWLARPDPIFGPMIPVKELAEKFHKIAKGRPVVLITCNFGGRDLDIRNTYYYKTGVWVVPDSLPPMIKFEHEIDRWMTNYNEKEPGVGLAGSIWEAVSSNETLASK